MGIKTIYASAWDLSVDGSGNLSASYCWIGKCFERIMEN